MGLMNDLGYITNRGDKVARVVPLWDAKDPDRVGGKAHALYRLINGGVRVPAGAVIPTDLTSGPMVNFEFIIEWFQGVLGDHIRAALPVAVRSSAIGEDGNKFSHAGRYDSVLNVYGRSDLYEAVYRVYNSAKSDRATRYREKAGLAVDTKIAIVIQEMVIASHAAVIFTKNPVTGEAQVIVEVVHGLGDDLVSGKARPATWMRQPDKWEKMAGPDIAVPDISGLMAQLEKCVAVMGRAIDVEAAFDTQWYIVQARPITTGG